MPRIASRMFCLQVQRIKKGTKYYNFNNDFSSRVKMSSLQTK